MLLERGEPIRDWSVIPVECFGGPLHGRLVDMAKCPSGMFAVVPGGLRSAPKDAPPKKVKILSLQELFDLDEEREPEAVPVDSPGRADYSAQYALRRTKSGEDVSYVCFHSNSGDPTTFQV